MVRTAPEERATGVIHWPWQLSVVAGLLAFIGVPGLVIAVLVLIGTLASGALVPAVFLLLGVALGCGVLMVAVRLYTRPTWPWWWAALGSAVLPAVSSLGDRTLHGGRVNRLGITLAVVTVMLLLAPASRRTVSAFSEAQARRATTSRNSQSIEPPVDESTQA